MTLHGEAALPAHACTARPSAAASNVTKVDGRFVATQGRWESFAVRRVALMRKLKEIMFEKLRVSLGASCHESRL